MFASPTKGRLPHSWRDPGLSSGRWRTTRKLFRARSRLLGSSWLLSGDSVRNVRRLWGCEPKDHEPARNPGTVQTHERDFMGSSPVSWGITKLELSTNLAETERWNHLIDDPGGANFFRRLRNW